MMKSILFIHHASSVGGGSYCMLNILRELDRSKYRPAVLLKEDGPLKAEVDALGIDVSVLPSIRQIAYTGKGCEARVWLSYLKVMRAALSFRKWLQAHPFDAVYLNSIVLYPFLKVARDCGCKAFLHIREHWMPGLQLRLAQRAVHAYADGIVAINGYSASMFPAEGERIRVVHDWIDFSSRSEERPFSALFGGDMTGRKVYLFTGGLFPIKGAREVLTAFHGYLTDPEDRLLALGVDPDAVPRTAYEQECLDILRSDSRIKCLPATWKVKQLYAQAYCNLSFFTLPHANLTLAECALLGTPSVAVRTEEALEYSLGGKTALLCRPGDFADFVEKLRQLPEVYPSLKKQLVTESDALRTMFDRSRNLAVLNALLDEVLL